jgi:hypothetical protein
VREDGVVALLQRSRSYTSRRGSNLGVARPACRLAIPVVLPTGALLAIAELFVLSRFVTLRAPLGASGGSGSPGMKLITRPQSGNSQCFTF